MVSRWRRNIKQWADPFSGAANPSVYKMTPLNSRLLYHSDHDGARLATRLRAPTPDKLKAAASILTLTPSAIKIYAGDEIGIKGFSDFNDFKNKWFHAGGAISNNGRIRFLARQTRPCTR